MLIRRGVAGSLLVLLGGLLTSFLPRSTPLVQLEVVGVLREHMVGRMLGLTLVMAGLGLLGAAWLSLCRRVRSGQADVETVRLATLCWSLPLLLAPPLFSRDGWSYAAQGALVRAGWSPYEYGPAALTGPIWYGVDPRWAHTPTPYGPLPLIFGDSFAALTDQPWLLVVAHRGVALVGLVLLAWAVPQLARYAGANPAFASALVCASPLMIANGVGGLHNDLLMAGLMAAALVVAIERGWLWGAAVAGLAMSVKAPGGLICVAIVLATLPAAAPIGRRLARMTGATGIALAVVVVLGGVRGLGLGWVDALSVPGTVATPLSVTTLVGQGLDWLLGTDPMTAPIRESLRGIGSLVVLAVTLGTLLRGRSGSPLAGVRAAALTTGVLVVLSPVVHLWYLLWALPFVAALPWGRRVTTALVATCVIAGLVAPLDSSLHGAYAAIVTGIMWALVAAVALLATRVARERLRRIAEEPEQVEPQQAGQPTP